MNTDWFLSWYRSSTPVAVDPRCMAELKAGVICRLCHCVLPSKELPPVLQVRCYTNRASLNIMFGLGLTVASTELLDAIGHEVVEKCMTLYALKNEHDRPLPHHRVTRCRSRIMLRGDTMSSFRFCAECGRLLLWAHGDQYATQPPSAEYLVHEGNGGGWIIHDSLVKRLQRFPLRAVRFLPLPIHPPIDGLTIPQDPARRFSGIE